MNPQGPGGQQQQQPQVSSAQQRAVQQLVPNQAQAGQQPQQPQRTAQPPRSATPPLGQQPAASQQQQQQQQPAPQQPQQQQAQQSLQPYNGPVELLVASFLEKKFGVIGADVGSSAKRIIEELKKEGGQAVGQCTREELDRHLVRRLMFEKNRLISRPELYVDQYESLREWVHGCLDIFKARPTRAAIAFHPASSDCCVSDDVGGPSSRQNRGNCSASSSPSSRTATSTSSPRRRRRSTRTRRRTPRAFSWIALAMCAAAPP